MNWDDFLVEVTEALMCQGRFEARELIDRRISALHDRPSTAATVEQLVALEALKTSFNLREIPIQYSPRMRWQGKSWDTSAEASTAAVQNCVVQVPADSIVFKIDLTKGLP